MNNDLTQNKYWGAVLFICLYFCSMRPEIQACLKEKIPATNVKKSSLDGYWKNVLLTAQRERKFIWLVIPIINTRACTVYY